MKVIGLLVMFLLARQGYGQKQKVVFVCEHGVARSVIAANYFNSLAAKRGLNYEAFCRATNPDSTLSQATRAGLRSDNIPQNKNPQKLSLVDTGNVSRIIVFTPLPSSFTTNIVTEDWSTIPNVNGTYEQRKEAIIRRINVLLDSLEKQKRHEQN